MSKIEITDEIELRLLTEENAEELFTIVKANFEHLRPYLYWVTPDYSLKSAKDFIATSAKAHRERKNEVCGIFYENKLIGVIGFINFHWLSESTEIGYWISKDFEGKSIVYTCCKALIERAFNELQINRIEIRCATENSRSRAIPERLGFKLEGILRQSQWRHTRFYDIAVYGSLAEDWSEKVKG